MAELMLAPAAGRRPLAREPPPGAYTRDPTTWRASRRALTLMKDTMRPFAIDGRNIAPAQPPFIVAEAGINHNGDLHGRLR